MKYTPTRVTARLNAVCIPLIVLAFLLFAAANFLPYPGLIQAAGGICLVVFLFLFLRFGLSSFSYEIEKSSLIVYRSQGRRVEKQCDVELSASLRLMTKAEFKAEKPAYALCYNYCQNFASDNRAYLLFLFDEREDKRALIIFEPSEEMKAEISHFLPKE